MTPIQKLLLRFIQENKDEDSQVKMSNSEIAKQLDVHAMSISKGIKVLKQKGVIETKYEDNLRRVITLLG